MPLPLHRKNGAFTKAWGYFTALLCILIALAIFLVSLLMG